MEDGNEPGAVASAERSDWLTAHRENREIRLTVTQLRHGLHPWSAALAALAEAAGVGAVRCTGGDQFVAGPLPLSLLAQDGAEPGAVLAWDGTHWAPVAPPGNDRAVGGGEAKHASPRRVIACDARTVVVGPGECGAVLMLTAGRDGAAAVWTLSGDTGP